MLILADDLGWGDVACYDAASKIPTPHIDRLASEGMRFTDAHSPSAVCTPTRYGILTGRYAWRTRMKSQVLGPYNAPLIEPGRVTLAGLLSEAGYATACIGKWHLGMRWATHEGGVLPLSLTCEYCGGCCCHACVDLSYASSFSPSISSTFIQRSRSSGLNLA